MLSWVVNSYCKFKSFCTEKDSDIICTNFYGYTCVTLSHSQAKIVYGWKTKASKVSSAYIAEG